MPVTEQGSGTIASRTTQEAPEAALAASAELLRQGFHVPAIRPPTVPAGTCRLRVALSASHRDEDIDELVGALERAVKPPRSRL